MKDRSDDPSHHERMLLPRSYISLLVRLEPEPRCKSWTYQLMSDYLAIAPIINPSSSLQLYIKERSRSPVVKTSTCCAICLRIISIGWLDRASNGCFSLCYYRSLWWAKRDNILLEDCFHVADPLLSQIRHPSPGYVLPGEIHWPWATQEVVCNKLVSSRHDVKHPHWDPIWIPN